MEGSVLVTGTKNGEWSETERRRVLAYLSGVSDSLRVLRADSVFWLSLGPALRVRWEDFQGDLAALRRDWRG